MTRNMTRNATHKTTFRLASLIRRSTFVLALTLLLAGASIAVAGPLLVLENVTTPGAITGIVGGTAMPAASWSTGR